MFQPLPVSRGDAHRRMQIEAIDVSVHRPGRGDLPGGAVAAHGLHRPAGARPGGAATDDRGPLDLRVHGPVDLPLIRRRRLTAGVLKVDKDFQSKVNRTGLFLNCNKPLPPLLKLG